VRIRSVVVGAAGSLLLAAAALAPGLPAPVAAADPLETVTTYSVDPDRSQVTVAVDVAPNPSTLLLDGPGTDQQYQIPAEVLDVWISDAAVDLEAKQGGVVLPWTPAGTATDPSGYHRIEVAVPTYRARTVRHVAVTYTMPDAGIRASGDTRVLPDYVHLCVHGSGPLDGRVIVDAPLGYALDTTFSGASAFQATMSGGRVVLESYSFGTPDTWWGCLALIDPAQDHVTSVVTGGGTVTLRAWPGDATWQTRATAAIEDAVPQLVALIGQPLPKVAGLTIREAFVAAGYEGQYRSDANQIVLSEFLTSETPTDGTVLVAHELAHAWFNETTQGPVWLEEGSAEWAARSVVTSSTPCLAAPPGANAKTLATWTYLSADYTKAEQQAVWDEYDTACTVVTLVAGAAGPDGMRAALAALMAHRDPYGATTPTSSTGAVSWREWLDAMDELGISPHHGSDSLAGALLLKYGVTTDSALIAARLTARRAYHDLISRAAPWTVPAAIRNQLSAWRFPASQEAISTASDAWDDVVASDRLVPGANAVSGPIRVQWESARTQDDLDAVLALARAQLNAARDVAAAMAPLQSPLGFVPWVGSLGSSSPTLSAAQTAIGAGDPLAAERAAADLRADMIGYEREGSRRLGLGSIVAFTTLVLLGLVVVSRVTWRPRQRAVVAAVATVPVSVTVFEIGGPSVPGSRDQHLPPAPPDWYATMRADRASGPPPPPRLIRPRPLIPPSPGQRAPWSPPTVPAVAVPPSGPPSDGPPPAPSSPGSGPPASGP
jgi:hypothetical protein